MELIWIWANRSIDTSIFTHAHLNRWVVKMASEKRIVSNPAGKSHVWKHFGFISSEDGTPVKDKAVCQLCSSEVSYCKNTTNVYVHLEWHHQSEYALLLKAEGERINLWNNRSQHYKRLQNELTHYQKIANGGKLWLKVLVILSHVICSHCQLWRMLDLDNWCTQLSLVSRFHLELTLLTP